MKKSIQFQFKILQYIHDSVTGEFLNVGIALYSNEPRTLRVKLLNKYSRITKTFPTADGDEYHRYILSLQSKFEYLMDKVNSKQFSYQSEWMPGDLAELLSSVLPIDDSSLQFGPTRGGICDNLDDIFDDLFVRLVEKYISIDENLSRTDHEIWNMFVKPIRESSALTLLQSTVIRTEQDDIELEHAWKNGRWNALQPISFDLMHVSTIQKKARTWLGTNVILNDSPDLNRLYYLLGKPQREDAALFKAYMKAKDLIGTGDYSKKVELIEEDQAEDFAKDISEKIKVDVRHQK